MNYVKKIIRDFKHQIFLKKCRNEIIEIIKVRNEAQIYKNICDIIEELLEKFKLSKNGLGNGNKFPISREKLYYGYVDEDSNPYYPKKYDSDARVAVSKAIQKWCQEKGTFDGCYIDITWHEYYDENHFQITVKDW